MNDADRHELVAAWAADFAGTPGHAELPPAGKEWSDAVLPRLLERACAERDRAPADLEEPDLKAGLLEGVRALELPASARAVVPDVCAAFLGELEAQGRLAGGRALGRYVRALRPAWTEATAETVRPIRNPGARIGRNDPCPCGSGRKFKRCCMRA